MVKKPEALMMQAIMDTQHEGQQVAATADVRDWPGQSGTAPPERVPGCGNPHPAASPADAIASVRSREVHARRDRQTTRAQGSGSGGPCRKARYHTGLVTKSDHQQIRRLEAPQVPRPPTNRALPSIRAWPEYMGCVFRHRCQCR